MKNKEVRWNPKNVHWSLKELLEPKESVVFQSQIDNLWSDSYVKSYITSYFPIIKPYLQVTPTEQYLLTKEIPTEVLISSWF